MRYLGLIVALCVLIITFSLTSEHFFQLSTAITISNRLPELTLVAVGMTFVMIIGGIDLSVGALMAQAGAISALLMTRHEWPAIWAFAAAIVWVGAIGQLSGLITVAFKVPAFIVTLGVLWFVRGTTKVFTDSQVIFVGAPIEWFGKPLDSLRLSPAFFLVCFVVLFGQWILLRTVIGRYWQAIGSNSKAVELSGIRIRRFCISAYVVSAVLAAVAGIASASRLSCADPNAAIGIELSAIAACVLGGTSLQGGRGSIIATFLGVLLIEILQTGLAQLGLSDARKQMLTGVVVLLAVIVDANPIARLRLANRQ